MKTSKNARFTLLLCAALSLPAIVATGTVIPGTSLTPDAWYEADEGVTLNGSYVSAWADKSGNGNTAYQTTAAAQPLLVLGATPSGQPVLRFDGPSGNDGLIITNALSS